ncbi:MAG: NADH dehydrogenase FAD-containing subunit, partial [Halobaculum sp.]
PTEGERPTGRADLQLTDRTLALGDAARVVDADGEAVPASASAAVREAKTAARNLTRLVEHEQSGDSFRPRLDRYRFDVPGWLVSVGDGAVAQLGPTVLTGAAAKAAKTTVGAGYLTTVGAMRKAVSLAEEELS